MIYLRNLAARRTVAIPVAVGWHRLLRPAVTSAVPELLLPAVRKLLARKLVAHVDTGGWDADERQRRSERAGMANLVLRAEQAAFDRLLQPVRIRPRRK